MQKLTISSPPSVTIDHLRVASASPSLDRPLLHLFMANSGGQSRSKATLCLNPKIDHSSTISLERCFPQNFHPICSHYHMSFMPLLTKPCSLNTRSSSKFCWQSISMSRCQWRMPMSVHESFVPPLHLIYLNPWNSSCLYPWINNHIQHKTYHFQLYGFYKGFTNP